MYHLEGEMAFIPGARSVGKLFSWKRMYDFYQVLIFFEGGEKKKTLSLALL